MRNMGSDQLSRRLFVRNSVSLVAGAALVGELHRPGRALAQPRTTAKLPAIGVNTGYALKTETAQANIKAFEQVIGRPVDYIVDFGGQASWREAITSAVHALKVWREVSVGSRRKLLWHQPLTMKDTPLSEVAAGKHDATFEVIATQIRNAGFFDAIINLGWDMTGSWFAWSATPDTRAAYVASYQRVAAIFRRISPSYKMGWSPSRHMQSVSPADCYPGDEHVDLVGMAVYVVAPPLGPDLANYVETTIIGHGQQPIPGRQPFALAWLAEFAKLHGKGMIIPEIAIGVEVASGLPPEASPILDDDVVISRLSEWIKQNGVLLHGWRDLPNGDSSALHSRMSRSSLIAGAKPSQPADERPKLVAAYRKAWGGK